MQGVQFTILLASPCAADFYEIWHTRSTHQHNYMCQIFVNRFTGCRVLTPPKLPFPTDLLRRHYNSVRTAVRQCDCLQGYFFPDTVYI